MYSKAPMSAPGTGRSTTRPNTVAFNTANNRRIAQVISSSLIRSSDTRRFFEPNTLGKTSFEDQDDSFEIAAQLKILRKNHDRQVFNATQLQGRLSSLKHELSQVEYMEQAAGKSKSSMSERIKSLEQGIKDTKHQQQETIFTQNVYKHVLERMKQTIIHLDVKTYDLLTELKTKGKTLTDEEERMYRSKEKSKVTVNAAKKLEQTLREQSLEQSVIVKQFQNNISKRQNNGLSREERARRQIEIAERAANEDRDQRAQRMRESLMVHRLWIQYLTNKLDSEKQKSSKIEEAFQRIRAATGLNDVGEVVERFLTKEQSYSSVLDTVAKLQHKINSIRDHNENIENSIKRLKLEKSVEDASFKPQHKEISRVYKEIDEAQQKHNKVLIIHKKVTTWLKRIMKRLFADQPEKLQDLPQTIPELVQLLQIRISELAENVSPDEVKQFTTEKARLRLDEVVNQIPEELMTVGRKFRTSDDSVVENQ